MKITFSNLGAIKKTTLDLRPLTVIIGPNNSNKTYIAYSIYGLMQSIVNTPMNSFFDANFIVKDKFNFSFEINDAFYNFIIKNCLQKVDLFEKNLEEFFQDSSGKIFNQTRIGIDLSKSNVKKILSRISNKGMDMTDEQIEFNLKNNVLSVKIVSKESKKQNDKGNEITAIIGTYYYFINSLFPNPILLPAERNSFVITYKMLATRRFRILRENQRNLFNRKYDERQLELLKEQGDIRYPQPIEDFLDFLADIELETNAIKVLKEKLKFYELANNIEISLQRNNRTQFKQTKFGGKEIKVNVKKGLDIDLYNASSSIKQLAPLLLYLRYRARENDLLIIDEPEMNLHPESQAKLLEVLGMLVNAGVNVLLTTHSPYFMSHLNNLIAGDMNDDETREKQAESLYLGDARAFLKPEDVSAYEMRQNKAGNQTLHDLHDKDYGIRWDTLSDVSADIQQKFFEIYENGKETSKGKEK